MDAERLKVETLILDKYFPNKYIIEGNAFFIELLSNKNNGYKIKIVVSESYPSVAPKVFVIEPVLADKDGILLSKIGSSWQFHTSAPDSEGNIQISCAGNWEHDLTIVIQALKALVWINAYEATFDLNSNINHLLGNKQDFFTHLNNP